MEAWDPDLFGSACYGSYPSQDMVSMQVARAESVLEKQITCFVVEKAWLKG